MLRLQAEAVSRRRKPARIRQGAALLQGISKEPRLPDWMTQAQARASESPASKRLARVPRASMTQVPVAPALWMVWAKVWALASMRQASWMTRQAARMVLPRLASLRAAPCSPGVQATMARALAAQPLWFEQAKLQTAERLCKS